MRHKGQTGVMPKIKTKQTKGPFKSAITGLFITKQAAARWPKSSFSVGRRKQR